jgi:uncharacterized repeat protein (TIGR03803 family)
MKRNRFWAACGRTLAVVATTLIVISMLASGAWASEYKVLYTFTGGPDGDNPTGLIMDATGNLYSTTTGGGIGNCQWDGGCGTVFQLTPNPDGSWTKTVLYNFAGSPGDGGYPLERGHLIFDGSGNLYGTSQWHGAYGQGTVFKLMQNPDGSWSDSVLYSFAGKDGAVPFTSLIFDIAGDLYSTTLVGGKGDCQIPWGYGCGVAFKLTPNPDGSWTKSKLHKFAGGMDGANPWAGLTFDPAGNLVGTTTYGGAYGSGIIFQLTPQPDGRWIKKAVHHFNGGRGGANPLGGLISDAAGNFYGTGSAGGAYGNGVVYKLTPTPNQKWGYRVIHQFKGGEDGANPGLDLTFDPAGNLYGVTGGGGACGKGVAYKLAPNPDGSWKRFTLHSFTCGDDGQSPSSSLILDASGNIYGVAFGHYWICLDSDYQCGVVFKITQ